MNSLDEIASATASTRHWICCQLGAREHYSIARGLHQRGLLAGLVTEAWVPPNSLLARIGGERLMQRYDEELADANVCHATASAVGYELIADIWRLRTSWNSIMARNDWFQTKAVGYLNAIARKDDQKLSPIVFSYSYAARRILRAARSLGFIPVLGQIDPGPVEERIVSEVCLRHGHQMHDKQRIPESYWDIWREECKVCDSIIVNSNWTREALIGEGVKPDKLVVVPLAYDPPEQSYQFERVYPASFDHSRPLRILFLGSLIPRKGIYELLDAASKLKSAPVKVSLVGASATELKLKHTDNVHWAMSVPRNKVHDFYKSADVFIFPTHSDGFGLTQLEAMGWALPVIASKNCGDVVTHQVNGLVLPAVTAEDITQAINWLLDNPDRLEHMSESALKTSKEYRSGQMISRLLRCRFGQHQQ